MSALKTMGQMMLAGARAHAQWELEMSRRILSDKKRLIILGLCLLPAVLGGLAFADQIAQAAGDHLPSFLGGKKAYSPAFYSTGIFLASIAIGLCAGLITGCIGAGGGFIIAPALMSAGIKGILAVGTDLFHIFAKAIMGSVIHRKLGNVSVSLAVTFLIGAIGGATCGGLINRVLYEINPVLSDAFITTIYSLMLGGLGFYALGDFFKCRKSAEACELPHSGKTEGAELGGLPKKLQAMNIPPMVRFDQSLVPGGRKISAWFLIISGFLVGLAAGIMGVGGGFLTFPIFVYTLGVSSMTTVGTDIFQIVFTAGYAAISQYAIYGFIFYTLAMGMLIGSLLGIQIGAMVTKVVPGITIRGFYAMAVLAGFMNRIFALPGKLTEMEVLNLSTGTVKVLDQIGIWAFFVVIGGFGVWVIGTFFKNTRALRGAPAPVQAAGQEVRS
ncbi:MAG: sulfite exporter TauE/SafE family protein [Thermodesulfobacteriota bacterium]